MATDEKVKVPSPPYTSWPSFKTLLTTLNENGVPGRIDRSMLGKFSGGVAGQLLTALRFLSLTDDLGHPTVTLSDLVAAFGSPAWPGTLAKVIKGAYASLFELKLDTASPAQFNDAFRKAFSAEGDTFRKCVTFFLSAAKEAEIAVSPYIMQNKKPRSAPLKRKVPKYKAPPAEQVEQTKGKQHDDGVDGGVASQGNGAQPTVMSAEQVLFELLHHEMDDVEKQAVFTLLLYLKKPKKNGGNR